MSATTRRSSAPKMHERELWRRLDQHDDQAARAELVSIHLPMAGRMAARYAGVREPYDDLFQVASLGLLNAIDRYEIDREVPFVGYAKPTILGELKRYFRDKVWTIRIPRELHDRLAAIAKATEELTEELSRAPSLAEIAGRAQFDPDEVLDALVADDRRRPLGFDAPIGGDEGEPANAEWLGGDDDGYELVEDRLTLRYVLAGLDPHEREILHLRFIEELPQSQIAMRLGCSQMQVSRLLRATLVRLGEEADGGGRAGSPHGRSHQSPEGPSPCARN